MTAVSVVLATFQGGRYLREQLESVLQQTRPPAEVIVADDGSTDDTLAVAQRVLAASGIAHRVMRNERRLGYRRNFVSAVGLATAPLIAFCDQDDTWRADKLEVMAAAFDDPRVLLAYHDAHVREPGGQRSRLLYGPDGVSGRSESALLEPWSFSLGFTQMFRRELARFDVEHARSRDFLFPDEVLGHDQWYFQLAGLLGRVEFVDEPLVDYRQHDANVFGAVDRSRARGAQVLVATARRSRGQLDARRAFLDDQAAMLARIAETDGVPQEWRVSARRGGAHLRRLAALHRRRLRGYDGGVAQRSLAFAALLARAPRLRRVLLRYPLRHAVRDGVFGVLLGRFAERPERHR